MTTTETTVKSEKAFSDLWERTLELRPTIVDAQGVAYEVVFPGIRNQGPGPDFKGAVIRRQGRTIAGDVELHLDPSGWRGHRHHLDPAYRGVVLQVVLRPGGSRGAEQAPPTAAAFFNSDHHEPPPLETPSAMDIRRLGINRFLSKSSGFRMEMEAGADPDEVMYRALVEAMGYVRNRKPFLALARSAPVSRFARLSAEPVCTATFAIMSSLIVAGGLIDRVERVERCQMRRVARSLGVQRTVSPGEWSRFRVRPGNSPQTRIRGIAPVIASHLGTGILRGMLSAHHRGGHAALTRQLVQAPSIGQGLARTVAASAALPVLHAWSGLARRTSADRIVESFGEMPAPPADSVTRGVAAALGLSLRVRTAADHSGLHELARSRSWPTDRAGAPTSALRAGVEPRQ